MRSSLLIAVVILFWYSSQLYSETESAEFTKASQYLEERGEVCFNFYVSSMTEIDNLSKIISIDKVDGNKVFAYANKEEFNEFLSHNLYYEVAVPPGLLTTVKCSDYSDQKIPYDWTEYPTYTAYLEIMDNFGSTYPDICKIYEFGTSNNGKKLLCARISDNVEQRELEPEFFATSTIHGDETLGFVLMLRMIEYLCMNYPNDATVKKIVEGVDLHINPLTNPDGSFGTGTSITNPRRYNANNKDLNRNFENPGNKYGTYSSYEKETRAVIDWEDDHKFVLGLDIHGGMENVVRPWAYARQRTIDEDWYVYTSRNYANTVHDNSVSGYLTYPQSNGYGCAGIDYYTAPGTRMDGPYYHSHFRCITLELHTTKFLAESRLDAHWGYNKQALLDLFLETLNGVQGRVSDLVTDESIYNVKVWVEDHDADSSFVRSDTNGFYARPIIAGSYDFTFSHPDYQSKTIENVQVTNGQPTILNVQLWDGSTSVAVPYAVEKPAVSVFPVSKGFLINYGRSSDSPVISIYTTKGTLVRTLTSTSAGKQSITWDGRDNKGQYIGNGCYLLKLKDKRGTSATSFIVNQ